MRLKMLLYFIIACCWGRTTSIPQHILNEFKTAFLPIFGLKERPKFDGKAPHIPDDLKKLYALQNNLEYETASLPLPGLHTKSANTVRSFVHVESSIDEKFPHHNKFRLKFDLSSIPKEEKLKAAEIKLTRESLSLDASSPMRRLLVHDIIRRGKKGTPPITRLIDSQLIDVTKNTTISIDVYPAAHRWFTDPKSNHGVLIVLHTKKKQQKHLRLRRDVDNPQWWQKQPLLYTYTDDGKNKPLSKTEMMRMRPKRGTRRHRKLENPPCRRHQMYVDFKEVGWSDWIVAPLGYDAFYCAGECNFPIPDHLNTTNHAIVQALFHSMRPRDVPNPCCVPTHLSSMSMLYVGSDANVILKNYKDMVVDGCGCR